ncbi:MAG: hypothetical protein WCD79_04090 [Chthoniobacteraceae bacterium]
MKASDPALNNLKRLLWLYLFLLIFEGALRKWVVPQLSTPLLIARDPIVLLIYMLAMSRGIFPKNPLVQWMVVLAVLSFFASLAGIGTLKVTIYGLHANFLHLPLIFLIPKIFDEEDVKKVGFFLLLLAGPMALLVLKQFRSSPDAWINATAGGEVGGQMYAAAGKIRPAGLFSFVTGMVSYISVVAAYLSWHFLDGKIYRRILIFVAVPSFVLSIAVSGSRSAVAAVVIVFAAVVMICLFRGKAGAAGLRYGFLLCVIFIGMSLLPVFREGIAVQEERFEEGGGVHEGIVDRFFGELVDAVIACPDAPILGLGLGLGTNAGAGMVSGERGFLLSEGEWSRVIMESGPVLGLGYIALRFAILYRIWVVAKESFRKGSSLPFLLVGAMGLDLVTGQFGQPTELGFVVFTCGLCLVPMGDCSSQPGESRIPSQPVQESEKRIRGRSRYAEILHDEKPKS